MAETPKTLLFGYFLGAGMGLFIGYGIGSQAHPPREPVVEAKDAGRGTEKPMPRWDDDSLDRLKKDLQQQLDQHEKRLNNQELSIDRLKVQAILHHHDRSGLPNGPSEEVMRRAFEQRQEEFLSRAGKPCDPALPWGGFGCVTDGGTP